MKIKKVKRRRFRKKCRKAGSIKAEPPGDECLAGFSKTVCDKRTRRVADIRGLLCIAPDNERISRAEAYKAVIRSVVDSFRFIQKQKRKAKKKSKAKPRIKLGGPARSQGR